MVVTVKSRLQDPRHVRLNRAIYRLIISVVCPRNYRLNPA